MIDRKITNLNISCIRLCILSATKRHFGEKIVCNGHFVANAYKPISLTLAHFQSNKQSNSNNCDADQQFKRSEEKTSDEDQYRNNSKDHWWYNFRRNKYDSTKKLSRFYTILPTLAIVGIGLVEVNKVSCTDKSNAIKVEKDIASSPNSEKQNEDNIIKNGNSKAATSVLQSNSINRENIQILPMSEQTLPCLPKEELNKKYSEPPVSKRTSTLKSTEAIAKATTLISRKMLESGTPGISIAVTIDGQTVWSAGYGYADIENSVRMNSDTVMRIASISKSMTMAGVGKLVEEGMLDLDAPIQNYVPNFPKKFVHGEEVTITTRQLLSHTSGIRHYLLKEEIYRKKIEKKNGKNKDNASKSNNTVTEKEKDLNALCKEKRDRIKKILTDKMFQENNIIIRSGNDFDLKEYYIKEHFNSIQEALELFKDDDLLFKPGKRFSYTTHGYTLVSAVVEGASGKLFTKFLEDMFKEMGLNNTYLDKNDDLIYKRARYYIRSRSHRIHNAPYVDNSYKWAGGGILSTVDDLATFGNILMYSFQRADEEKDNVSPPGFLTRATMNEMWKPCPLPGGENHFYALGWSIVEPDLNPAMYCALRSFCSYHNGGAVGASSILTILPSTDQLSEQFGRPSSEGVVVAIIANMQDMSGLHELAFEIAKVFSRVEKESKITWLQMLLHPFQKLNNNFSIPIYDAVREFDACEQFDVDVCAAEEALSLIAP